MFAFWIMTFLLFLSHLYSSVFSFHFSSIFFLLFIQSIQLRVMANQTPQINYTEKTTRKQTRLNKYSTKKVNVLKQIKWICAFMCWSSIKIFLCQDWYILFISINFTQYFYFGNKSFIVKSNDYVISIYPSWGDIILYFDTGHVVTGHENIIWYICTFSV